MKPPIMVVLRLTKMARMCCGRLTPVGLRRTMGGNDEAPGSSGDIRDSYTDQGGRDVDEMSNVRHRIPGDHSTRSYT